MWFKKKEIKIRNDGPCYGPETEGKIERLIDNPYFIYVEWYKYGKKYKKRVYEPGMISLSDCLADLIVIALEGGESI